MEPETLVETDPQPIVADLVQSPPDAEPAEVTVPPAAEPVVEPVAEPVADTNYNNLVPDTTFSSADEFTAEQNPPAAPAAQPPVEDGVERVTLDSVLPADSYARAGDYAQSMGATPGSTRTNFVANGPVSKSVAQANPEESAGMSQNLLDNPVRRRRSIFDYVERPNSADGEVPASQPAPQQMPPANPNAVANEAGFDPALATQAHSFGGAADQARAGQRMTTDVTAPTTPSENKNTEAIGKHYTVGDLKEILEGVPDDTPLYRQGSGNLDVKVRRIGSKRVFVDDRPASDIIESFHFS